ncbi:MAG: hypothetical protein ABI548_10005 [Polyangiaceae bacterium]
MTSDLFFATKTGLPRDGAVGIRLVGSSGLGDADEGDADGRRGGHATYR